MEVPLKDFLKLEKMDLNKAYRLTDLIEEYQKYQMGFDDRRSFIVFCSLDLTSCFDYAFSKKENPKSYKENKEKLQSRLAEMIKEASDESLNEMINTCKYVENRCREESKEMYYSQLTKIYCNALYNLQERRDIAHILNTDVERIFSERPYVGVNELVALMGRRNARKMQDFVDCKGGITPEIVRQYHQRIMDIDKMIHDLHRELIEYASKEFGKDELDVVLDIAKRNTHLGCNVETPKKDILCILFGVKTVHETPAQEFSRGLFEEREYLKKVVKACYKIERKEKFPSKKYESKFEGHTEEKDSMIVRKLRRKFHQYVKFAGDYVFKNMHGAISFEKIFAVDVKRIRETHNSPETVIDNIMKEAEGYIEDQLKAKLKYLFDE